MDGPTGAASVRGVSGVHWPGTCKIHMTAVSIWLGVPQNGRLIRENPIQLEDDLGVPSFQETSKVVFGEFASICHEECSRLVRHQFEISILSSYVSSSLEEMPKTWSRTGSTVPTGRSCVVPVASSTRTPFTHKEDWAQSKSIKIIQNSRSKQSTYLFPIPTNPTDPTIPTIPTIPSDGHGAWSTLARGHMTPPADWSTEPPQSNCKGIGCSKPTHSNTFNTLITRLRLDTVHL